MTTEGAVNRDSSEKKIDHKNMPTPISFLRETKSRYVNKKIFDNFNSLDEKINYQVMDRILTHIASFGLNELTHILRVSGAEA